MGGDGGAARMEEVCGLTTERVGAKACVDGSVCGCIKVMKGIKGCGWEFGGRG